MGSGPNARESAAGRAIRCERAPAKYTNGNQTMNSKKQSRARTNSKSDSDSEEWLERILEHNLAINNEAKAARERAFEQLDNMVAGIQKLVHGLKEQEWIEPCRRQAKAMAKKSEAVRCKCKNPKPAKAGKPRGRASADESDGESEKEGGFGYLYLPQPRSHPLFYSD